MEDPEVFVRPWTAVNYFNLDAWTVNGNQDRLFEYACHEHNYGIGAIRGAQVDREWALDEARRERAVREGEIEAKWELLLAWEESPEGSREPNGFRRRAYRPASGACPAATPRRQDDRACTRRCPGSASGPAAGSRRPGRRPPR